MIDKTVVDHYSRGSLEQQVIATLAANAVDPFHPTLDELAQVDEFHVGGRAATRTLGEHLDLEPGHRVLDLGSGLGGPARYLADRYGVSVTGVDLTPECVDVASWLTQLVGLTSRVDFRQGNVTDLPFPAESFDRAYLIHVGMNISDKAVLFAQARRVLVPGGLLLVYDVMRARPGTLAYPLPWASEESTSFVADAATFRDLLERTGFVVIQEEGWREFALISLRATGPGGPAVMGQDAVLKVANLQHGVESGLLVPTEIVARRP
jgi:ubiquinone/menaquinone biosynthesis C-methylase UbiE